MEEIANITIANTIADKIAKKASVESKIEEKQETEVKAVQESEKTEQEKREERREEQKEEERKEAAAQIWLYKSMPTKALIEAVQRESLAAPEYPAPTRSEAYKYAEQIVKKKVDDIV